ISSPRRSSIALYFNVSGTPRTLLSFPTRRSSDLLWQWRHVTQSPSLTEMTKPIVASKFHQNQSLPAAHRSADRSLHNALYFYCSPTTPRSSNDPTLASWHDKRYLADSYSNYLHLAYRRAHPHYCYSSFYHCCPN